MAKKANYRKIHSNSYYEPEELAKCVDLTVQTIYAHIPRGLPADMSKKPYNIYGRNAKEYFRRLYDNKIQKEHRDEIICNCCGKVFDITLSDAEAIFTGRFYNPKKAQIRVFGHCPFCPCKFSRFKSTTAIKGMIPGARIPIANITTRGE